MVRRPPGEYRARPVGRPGKRKDGTEKRGRKRFHLAPAQVEEIEYMISFGWMTNDEIISWLGVSKTTYYAWLERNPDIAQKFRSAKIGQKAAMMGRMTQLALDGNFQALKWRLSVCHGMIEKQTVVHETDPMKEKIAGMTIEQIEERYQKLKEKEKSSGKTSKSSDS